MCPEHWDTKLLVYRDFNKKAWNQREISQTLNLPGLLKVVGLKCFFF